MNENEAFIRAVVDNPGDDTHRLVYADWLDDRSDPRGPYLRAEATWAKTPSANEKKRASKLAKAKEDAKKQVSTLAKKVDPVWVARISRPPVGVCVEAKFFRHPPKLTTATEIAAVEQKYKVEFPPDYRAFLLNYNGGGFLYPPAFIGGELDEHAYIDFFSGLKLGKKSEYLDLERYADLLHECTDHRNRGSALFPIGGPDQEHTIYLLGIRGKYRGQVYSHGDSCMQWVGHEWCKKESETFASLLAELSSRTGED
jgi:uncharacterized protein (TIGR02996 family)